MCLHRHPETLGNGCEWKGWVGEEFGEGRPSHKCLGLDVTCLFTFLRQGLHRSSHLDKMFSEISFGKFGSAMFSEKRNRVANI